MTAVGGIFRQRGHAQQAADALVLAGLSARSLRYEVIPRSLINSLGARTVMSFHASSEPAAVAPGDIMLTVETDALPLDVIRSEIALAGGLVVEPWASIA